MYLFTFLSFVCGICKCPCISQRLTSGVFFNYSHHLFGDRLSHQVWSSSVWLGQLSRKLQGSSCLCLFSSGITRHEILLNFDVHLNPDPQVSGENTLQSHFPRWSLTFPCQIAARPSPKPLQLPATLSSSTSDI